MADNKKEDKKFGAWWNTVVVASIISALGLGNGKAAAKDSDKPDIQEKGRIENIDRTSASDSLKVTKVEEKSTTDNKQEQALRIDEIMKKKPADRTLAEYVEAREYYNGKNQHLAKADAKIQVLEAQAIATMQNLMEKGISDEEMKSVEKFMELYPKTDKYNTSVKDKFAEYVANKINPKQENVSEVSQDRGYVVGSRLANAIGGRRRTRVSYSRYGVTQTPIKPFLGGYTFSTTGGAKTESVGSPATETSAPKVEVSASEKNETDNIQTTAPKKKSWFARLFSKKEKDNKAVNTTVADAAKPTKVVIAQPWYQTFKFDSNNPEASFKEWAEKAGKPMTKDKLQRAINALPLAYREAGAHIRRWTEHAHQKGYQLDWNELPKNYKKELAEANETYAQQLGGSKGRNVNIASIGNRINKRMEGHRGDITGGKWNIVGRS